MYMGVKDKLKNTSSKFIDFDLALVFAPNLLLGIKIGSIMNKLLTNSLLLLGLMMLSVYSLKNTHRLVQIHREKERNFLQESLQHPPNNICFLNSELKKNFTSYFNYSKIKLLFVFEGILVLDLLLEGNSKITSIIGISR
jgi:hypothetical protein